MRIHGLVDHSRVNGPGDRAVIWFQGCSLGCAGCWNPETWNPSAGREMSLTEILLWLTPLVPSIEGISFSGGEPLQQAPELKQLITRIGVLFPSLSIGLFSGYTEKELDSGAYTIHGEPQSRSSARFIAQCEQRAYYWRCIRERLDWACLGRYNAQQPCSEPMRTSLNQVLRLYSDRYTLADFPPQSVEISIDESGATTTTGFPILGEL